MPSILVGSLILSVALLPFYLRSADLSHGSIVVHIAKAQKDLRSPYKAQPELALTTPALDGSPVFHSALIDSDRKQNLLVWPVLAGLIRSPPALHSL